MWIIASGWSIKDLPPLARSECGLPATGFLPRRPSWALAIVWGTVIKKHCRVQSSGGSQHWGWYPIALYSALHHPAMTVLTLPVFFRMSTT